MKMLRRVELGDVEQIALLEAANFIDPYARTFMEKCQASEDYVFLAYESSGRIAGYLLAQKSDAYDLMRICVCEKDRRTGIGHALISELKDRPVFLEVKAENAAAIAFYEHSGFRLASIRRDYYGAGKDALVCMRAKI